MACSVFQTPVFLSCQSSQLTSGPRWSLQLQISHPHSRRKMNKISLSSKSTCFFRNSPSSCHWPVLIHSLPYLHERLGDIVFKVYKHCLNKIRHGRRGSGYLITAKSLCHTCFNRAIRQLVTQQVGVAVVLCLISLMEGFWRTERTAH